MRESVLSPKLCPRAQAAQRAAARSLGVHTVGLLGRDGGPLAAPSDVPLIVPGQSTARIQEAHIFIGHNLCALVEKGLGRG
ncbi:hypothetical protein [Azohydromonas lata]|uniref:hypothetical protein n=1 Tax=Azohydromonas lata TaxID=45677 RepID=UPI0008330CB4|nr:hypothetical protein [Azohydromonas lata]